MTRQHSPRRPVWPLWRHLRTLLVLLLGTTALAGCQAMTEQWCKAADYCELSPEDDDEPVLGDLLQYALLANAMNDTALEAERERLAAAVTTDACSDDHVRLALVARAGEGRQALTDDALAGLAACREQTAQAPIRAALASVLHDAHTDQVASASRIDELEQRLDEEQSRNEALEEQLEALKAIERSIIERGRD